MTIRPDFDLALRHVSHHVSEVRSRIRGRLERLSADYSGDVLPLATTVVREMGIHPIFMHVIIVHGLTHEERYDLIGAFSRRGEGYVCIPFRTMGSGPDGRTTAAEQTLDNILHRETASKNADRISDALRSVIRGLEEQAAAFGDPGRVIIPLAGGEPRALLLMEILRRYLVWGSQPGFDEFIHGTPGHVSVLEAG